MDVMAGDQETLLDPISKLHIADGHKTRQKPGPLTASQRK